MYELVEKYLRKLDQELYKFKMELEADNAGITEVLEKRKHSSLCISNNNYYLDEFLKDYQNTFSKLQLQVL